MPSRHDEACGMPPEKVYPRLLIMMPELTADSYEAAKNTTTPAFYFGTRLTTRRRTAAPR